MNEIINLGSIILLIVPGLILLIPLIVPGIISYYIYKRNVERLNSVNCSHKIKPAKLRFLISWITYCLVAFILVAIILLQIIKDLSYAPIWVILFVMLFESLLAYPYYVLNISPDTLNGATQWGWLWERTDIRLDDIDIKKISQQRIRNFLGVTIIHSKNGAKIRTIGLSKEQISEIILLANNASSKIDELK